MTKVVARWWKIWKIQEHGTESRVSCCAHIHNVQLWIEIEDGDTRREQMEKVKGGVKTLRLRVTIRFHMFSDQYFILMNKHTILQKMLPASSIVILTKSCNIIIYHMTKYCTATGGSYGGK